MNVFLHTFSSCRIVVSISLLSRIYSKRCIYCPISHQSSSMIVQCASTSVSLSPSLHTHTNYDAHDQYQNSISPTVPHQFGHNLCSITISKPVLWLACGSVALDRRDFGEMVANIERGGQLQHDVRQGGMLEQLGGGQRWFAAWPLVATAKGMMGAQHNVAEHEAQYQRAQEVVTEKLHVR